MENTKDVIYFDDGEKIRNKAGKVDKIEDGVLYFFETKSNQSMLIPMTRIVRIVKGSD